MTAAGSGTRLGAAGPKALVEVAGESLVRRAVRCLAASGVVDHVVVTAPAEHIARFEAELVSGHATGPASGRAAKAGADSAARSDTGTAGPRAGDPAGARGAPIGIEVVPGSPDSRQASVSLGLAAALAARPGAAVVLVHDAARALTPPEVVRRVVAAVRAGYDAVVPAVPVSDTVKEVAATGRAGAGPADAGGAPAADTPVEVVVGTPHRSRLRAVQTPQGFASATLVAAHRLGADRAADEARAASDDAGLVEAAGGTVVVVEGDPLAMKVTTPLDLALAEVLAPAR
ncbi:2-C-methyl-D-erythritol 4-phosphate cytidylyltransferase [Actinomyces israelii]|uniref:2-C-methyl-D-erythritol 4-phosphate cytidylyltransferase n=1 Tax=Actinomyces israelii TaxID=1659 RepID=A0ABT4I8K8_9ACTO|nr:2-C-methyl-D-erythritol 4-phosphate cytidylyltransferase [Actinomyces israelii]MCZ0858080.1 2-C-methyl-D-erythritol 4-phosphate cytidylyltransferase [Actinomyces israelii]